MQSIQKDRAAELSASQPPYLYPPIQSNLLDGMIQHHCPPQHTGNPPQTFAPSVQHYLNANVDQSTAANVSTMPMLIRNGSGSIDGSPMPSSSQFTQFQFPVVQNMHSQGSLMGGNAPMMIPMNMTASPAMTQPHQIQDRRTVTDVDSNNGQGGTGTEFDHKNPSTSLAFDEDICYPPTSLKRFVTPEDVQSMMPQIEGPNSTPKHISIPHENRAAAACDKPPVDTPPTTPAQRQADQTNDSFRTTNAAFIEQGIQTNDVLCGRGGGTNHNVGNRRFRALVKYYQPLYVSACKHEKLKVSKSIVEAIRKSIPPGRFLERNRDGWVDIGDKRAWDKTSQTLREGAAEVRGEVLKAVAVHRNNTMRKWHMHQMLANFQMGLLDTQNSELKEITTAATPNANQTVASTTTATMPNDAVALVSETSETSEKTDASVPQNTLDKQESSSIAQHNEPSPPDIVMERSTTPITASQKSTGNTLEDATMVDDHPTSPVTKRLQQEILLWKHYTMQAQDGTKKHVPACTVEAVQELTSAQTRGSSKTDKCLKTTQTPEDNDEQMTDSTILVRRVSDNEDKQVTKSGLVSDLPSFTFNSVGATSSLSTRSLKHENKAKNMQEASMKHKKNRSVNLTKNNEDEGQSACAGVKNADDKKKNVTVLERSACARPWKKRFDNKKATTTKASLMKNKRSHKKQNKKVENISAEPKSHERSTSSLSSFLNPDRSNARTLNHIPYLFQKKPTLGNPGWTPGTIDSSFAEQRVARYIQENYGFTDKEAKPPSPQPNVTQSSLPSLHVAPEIVESNPPIAGKNEPKLPSNPAPSREQQILARFRALAAENSSTLADELSRWEHKPQVDSRDFPLSRW
eukprot:CAMPEP_0195520032 /NCGR_PEP_ID=MMETSP0794_2-20130614/15955_1 /TAXON_ID=515487 /ORGANISM="Stephanopyxis turris, Strain CCMP 815" /LENGTH=857 /DNA_ID=CAMNT_0040649301 /DNA_START=76 /DNA_END=2649 /DNA_ORIENTATION=+